MKLPKSIAQVTFIAPPVTTSRGLAALVCKCVYCQCDYAAGRPMRIARMREDATFPAGLYWLYARMSGKMYVTRPGATFFGPQHTSTLRKNKRLFVIVKPARQPPRFKEEA